MNAEASHNTEIDINTHILAITKLINQYRLENINIHAYDIKELLLEIRDLDEEEYFLSLKKIPNELLADVIAELPSHIQEETSERLGVKKLAQIATDMDTDDAADFLQNIGEIDTTKAEEVLDKIKPEDQKIIRSLISYEENVAGSYMQSELFSVKQDEFIENAINRLRLMKKNGEIDTLSTVFVIDDKGHYVCSVGLEEIILLSPTDNFQTILDNNEIKRIEVSANHLDDIKDIIEKVSDYNLGVIPIIDEVGVLLGRITSDDIYDVIEDKATDEMFGLAGLNADVEQADNIYQAAKKRALWLGINLITAIAASAVIAIFDTTIQSFVSLAILMPIVASMGGNAGTQSLTVTVRQLSTGDIELENALETIKKEVLLSLMNGLAFAIIIGFAAFYWFAIPSLGIVIALSTIINLLFAGFFGAIIPLFLNKLEIDPAIASSVLLTTITDIAGFLSFLGLAKLLM
jgi:magnesium transporter